MAVPPPAGVRWCHAVIWNRYVQVKDSCIVASGGSRSEFQIVEPCRARRAAYRLHRGQAARHYYSCQRRWRHLDNDQYRVARHLGDAVDRVRWAESRRLARSSDDRRLGGSRYLRGCPEHMDAERWRRSAALRASALQDRARLGLQGNMR